MFDEAEHKRGEPSSGPTTLPSLHTHQPYVGFSCTCTNSHRDVACVVKFFSMKMKHVPEASDIPTFADAVGAGAGGVEHHLDVVAQASGFSEKEGKDLDAFVAREGWGGDDGGDDVEEANDEKGIDRRDEEDGLEGSSSAEESEGEEGSGGEEGGKPRRTRMVRAPESVTKRAHAAVQRQRRAAGAEGAAKPSRNHQKRKEKGKILYKHTHF